MATDSTARSGATDAGDADPPLSVRDTALVTGSSTGIGRATALALREEGWRVFATGPDTDALSDLEEAGCETAPLDVTDPEGIEATVQDVVAEAGAIDCLVNNAGYAQPGPIEDVPTARVRRQFDVNVFGPHRVLRATLPHMREAGEGRVVTVGAASGQLAFPGTGVYAGAESALAAMTDALRGEVRDLGIDVVLVEPGPVETEFADRADRELRALERTEDYERFYGIHEDARTVGGLPWAVSAEDVADTVVEAATCSDPETRYRVGRVARLASMARHLPDGLRDSLLGLATRLLS